jgi:hypothetical protein
VSLFICLLFSGATERLFHGWMTGSGAGQLQVSWENFACAAAALLIL